MLNVIGVVDCNINEFELEDKVVFLNQFKGKIVFEIGAYGIAFEEALDYKFIQRVMDSKEECCGNKISCCFNDHFLTLYEISDMFNCEEEILHVVEII